MYSDDSLFLESGAELSSFNEDGSLKKKISITEKEITLSDTNKSVRYTDINLFENLAALRPEILDF
jgi:hypothetical protein